MKRLSLEAMAYQVKDEFPGFLADIVEAIHRDVDVGKLTTNRQVLGKYGKAVEQVIFDRFKLTIKLDAPLSDSYAVAIIPFSGMNLSELNTLTNGLSKSAKSSHLGAALVKIVEARDSQYKEFHNKKGTVNLKYGKVSGYLSEAVHYMAVNFLELKKVAGMSPMETVAAISHEIGHAFVGLTLHYKQATTNEHIRNVLDAMNNNTPEEVHYTYKRYFGEADLKEAGLSKGSKVTDFYGPLAGKLAGGLESTNGSAYYDKTNFEAMADDFVARLGIGEALASALSKVRLNPSVKVGYYSAVLGMQLIIAYVMAALISGLILSVGLWLVWGVVAFFIWSVSDMVNGESSGQDMTYDTLLDRYNRIKNSVANNLKDPNLPKELVCDLVSQYETIDTIMRDSFTKESIASALETLSASPSLKQQYYTRIQQVTENALNNGLFVKSAKLRTS